MKTLHPNIQMLEIIAKGLKDLLDQVYFVGGATTALYLDIDQSKTISTALIRSTEDVDCVVEIASYLENQAFERKLEKLGFEHCTELDSPICRWVFHNIKVDIMPSNPQALGFSNRWYIQGIRSAQKIKLLSEKTIWIFSIPYFLASKLEAFLNRGKGDFYGSKDFEDLITVIYGRSKIRQEIFEAPQEVKIFLREEFQKLTQNEIFIQSLSGCLGFLENPVEASRKVLDIVKSI